MVVALRNALVRRIMRLRAPSALTHAKAVLPVEVHGPLEYLATHRLVNSEDRVRTGRVEELRAAVAARTGDATIYYSPLPGSSGTDDSASARPRHGETVKFDWNHVATRTSIRPYWGRFLYLAAQARGAAAVLELGSCAGISGAYLASASSVRRLVTVEASTDLASVARVTIHAVLPQASVVNALFDEALDQLSGSEASFDLVWIDGHHEKVATIHYFNRCRPMLAPGAWVLFDDIAWSADMREAWRTLARSIGVRFAIDLGRCGLLIMGRGEGTYLDLRALTGTGYFVGQPRGWVASS